MTFRLTYCSYVLLIAAACGSDTGNSDDANESSTQAGTAAGGRGGTAGVARSRSGGAGAASATSYKAGSGGTAAEPKPSDKPVKTDPTKEPGAAGTVGSNDAAVEDEDAGVVAPVVPVAPIAGESGAATAGAGTGAGTEAAAGAVAVATGEAGADAQPPAETEAGSGGVGGAVWTFAGAGGWPGVAGGGGVNWSDLRWPDGGIELVEAGSGGAASVFSDLPGVTWDGGVPTLDPAAP